MNPKPLLTPFWLIAGSFVGIADTLYLSWNHLLGILPTCAIVTGCDVVLTSKYAEVFGVPLSYIGLGFYIYFLALALLLAYDPYGKGVRAGMLVYAAVGVVCSCVFAYMWVFVIHALCIYCLVSAITTFVLFALAYRHFFKTRGL